jgi:hypothetical protein
VTNRSRAILRSDGVRRAALAIGAILLIFVVLPLILGAAGS